MSDLFNRPWRWKIVHAWWEPTSEKGLGRQGLSPFSISASPGCPLGSGFATHGW